MSENEYESNVENQVKSNALQDLVKPNVTESIQIFTKKNAKISKEKAMKKLVQEMTALK